MLGLCLAVVGALFCLCVGWASFEASRRVALAGCYASQEALVHHLIESAAASTAESRLPALLSAWQGHGDGSGYLCVIDPGGKLLANTRRPDSVGRDVSWVPVREGKETVGDLLASQRSWTGRNVNAAGEEQVAAYVYSPEIGGIVAYHLAARDVDAKVLDAALPWGIGLGGAALLLALSSSVFVVAIASLRRELRVVAEQAAARNNLESMGLLVSGVAHDFNNLLTIIIGYADLIELKYEIPEILPLRTAGTQAAAMTGQLLALSRPDPTPEEGLDLNVVLAESSRLLDRVLPKGVELKLSLGNGLALVHLERGELNQVVLNLAVNARDAMPAGGLISLETSRVSLAGSEAKAAGVEAGDYVRFLVRDEGEGIAPEVIPRLFDLYFTTKEEGRGTGIGLATVGSIARRRGLGLRVTSTLGEGTCFEVLFPKA